MNDLDKLCQAPSAGLNLHQIMSRCNAYGMAWGMSNVKVALIVVAALLVGFFVLLSRRKELKKKAPPPGSTEPRVWTDPMLYVWTVEGILFGGLAAWAGSSAGVVIALMVRPAVLGALLLIFAAIGVFMLVDSLIKGTASASDQVWGVICHIALAGALVVAAIFAFMVPSQGRAGEPYQTYLWAVMLLFAATAFAEAWVVSIYRGYHGLVGWLLVPLNASWGLLGNLLGLMNHIACLFYFSNDGGVTETRAFFVRYTAGFHLRASYDYTQGDAMSANLVPKHEAVHVVQHFLFGPMYPLSYGTWAVTMFLFGIVAGAWHDKRTVAQGITDLCYYNCPWEQIAYAVEGTDNDGTDVLIFNKVVGWIVNIIWVGASAALGIAFIVSRT